MHDIDESGDRPAIACADSFVFHLKLPLVVEIRVTFVAVEGFFVLLGHFPDDPGNCATLALFNREVRAGLAALEQKLPSVQPCRAADGCMRAAHPHLTDIEVAAVSDVIAFFHN